MRVTDLSKPIEAESKLGSAPVDPSEFCASYISTYIIPIVPGEFLTEYLRFIPHET